MSTEEQLSPLGKTALQLVRWGFAVFPCKPNAKQPNTHHGLNDWSTKEDDIVDHWRYHPNDNVGIACGAPSGGLLVLDFDVDDEKGKDGLATVKEWERAHGELPDTCVAITGSGGRHYLYHTDRNTIRPSVNADLGVDVRCDGSYIIAPGSIHPNGTPYEWWASPDDCDIADADGNVYDFLDFIQRNGGAEEGTKKPNGKFKLPDKIKQGERDNTLFKYACSLRSVGRSDEEIKNAVIGANMTRCAEPLPMADIERICGSACKLNTMEGVGDPNAPMPKVPSAATIAKNVNIRGSRGGIKSNEVAHILVNDYYARLIDGAPAVWMGTRWDYGAPAIFRACYQIADDIKTADRNEVFNYIKANAPHVSSLREFDGHYYVQFMNCTFDVVSGEIVTPEPSMLITNQIAVELNFDARRNIADEFVESVSDGDAPTLQSLLEVSGACMCSGHVLNQAPLLIGTAGGAEGKASNGKSTWINQQRDVLGPENVSSLDIATLGQRFQAGRILGKLANLGDDIPNGFLKGDELSIFKKIVTGDPLYTDVKGADGFEFKPAATMVFSMNTIPRLEDSTDGVMRRLAPIPFRRRFTPGEPGYDPDLGKKLATPEALERAALLGLQALPDLISRGGVLPTIPDMVELMGEVKEANDSVLRWIVDADVTAEGLDGKSTEDVYRDYQRWCQDAGERERPRRTVTEKLKEICPVRSHSGAATGLKIVRERVQGTSKRSYIFRNV